MEKLIISVDGSDESYINELLAEGAKVKDMQVVAQQVAGACDNYNDKGKVYAYILLEGVEK